MNDQVQNQVAPTAQYEVAYHFRKNKETGLKRKSVELVVPVESTETIISILQDNSPENAKTRSMLLDQIYQPIVAAIRSRVDQNDDFDQAAFDAIPAKDYALHTLANLPRSERSTTTKEELEAFADSYVETMVGAEKISERAGDQAKALIIGRFKQVAGDTKVLSKMQERINEYMEMVSPEVFAEHEKAITTLVTKLDEALSVDYNADAL